MSGFTSSDETLSLIFTLSESLTLFDQSDVNINGGGILSSFTQSSEKTYTATFTPSIGGESFKSIFVNADSFQDQVGHLNTASNVFHWTFMCDDGYHKGEFSWNVVPGKMCHSSYTNIEGVTDIAVCKEACIDRVNSGSECFGFSYAPEWTQCRMAYGQTCAPGDYSHTESTYYEMSTPTLCVENECMWCSRMLERISHFLFNYSEDSVVSLT